MTASKSSRARNARMAAQAAARSGTVVKNGSARPAAAPRSPPHGEGSRHREARRHREAPHGTSEARRYPRPATAGGKRSVRRTGGRGTARAARGTRTMAVGDEPAERGPAPWLQIATFVLALAGLGVSDST